MWDRLLEGIGYDLTLRENPVGGLFFVAILKSFYLLLAFTFKCQAAFPCYDLLQAIEHCCHVVCPDRDQAVADFHCPLSSTSSED
jgi:hypothetical protein